MHAFVPNVQPTVESSALSYLALPACGVPLTSLAGPSTVTACLAGQSTTCHFSVHSAMLSNWQNVLFVSSIHTCFFLGADPVFRFWHHNVRNRPSLTFLLSMEVILAILETLKGKLPKVENLTPSYPHVPWKPPLETQCIVAVINALQFKS